MINTSTSVTWLNFNLEHKDIVKTTLKTTNGALNEITNTTDGYTVDLTPPKLKYIRDGLLAADISYQVIKLYICVCVLSYNGNVIAIGRSV